MKRIFGIFFLFEIMSAALFSQRILTQQEKDSIITSIGNTKIWQWGEPLGAIQGVDKF